MVLFWIFAEHFLLLDYINFLVHHNSSNRKESCLQSLYSTVNFSQAHPNPLSWLLILLWPRMKEVILIFVRNREEGLCDWTILYRAAGETKTACPDQKSESAAHQTRKAAMWWSQRTRPWESGNFHDSGENQRQGSADTAGLDGISLNTSWNWLRKLLDLLVPQGLTFKMQVTIIAEAVFCRMQNQLQRGDRQMSLTMATHAVPQTCYTGFLQTFVQSLSNLHFNF